MRKLKPREDNWLQVNHLLKKYVSSTARCWKMSWTLGVQNEWAMPPVSQAWLRA